MGQTACVGAQPGQLSSTLIFSYTSASRFVDFVHIENNFSEPFVVLELSKNLPVNKISFVEMTSFMHKTYKN